MIPFGQQLYRWGDFLDIRVNLLLPGGEWDYVILSTVRSLPRYEIDKQPTIGWLHRNMGFIIDENQINVALTRARKGLVILDEPRLRIFDILVQKVPLTLHRLVTFYVFFFTNSMGFCWQIPLLKNYH